jgi:hypothetical protein
MKFTITYHINKKVDIKFSVHNFSLESVDKFIVDLHVLV